MKHRFFENSYFPATITERNDLNYSLRNALSKFICLGPSKVFNIYSLYDLKLLTRLCLEPFLQTISSLSVRYFLKKGNSS